MKKTICFIIVLMIIALTVSAGQSFISTEKNADSLIVTGQGEVSGIIIQSDGVNNITMTVYDNTVTGGRKLTPEMIITTSASNRTHFIGFRKGECPFNKGIYVEITCVGALKYTVNYEKN
jgi:hypothetical protein